jgi:hypothetical protein
LFHLLAWIDIKLIFTEKIIKLLYSLLKEEPFRINSVLCLISIIKKGIISEDKLKLFQNLQIITVLKHFDIKDLEFSHVLADLANEYGVELNQIWVELIQEKKESYKDAFEQINLLVQIVFKLYTLNGSISLRVIPFITGTFFFF